MKKLLFIIIILLLFYSGSNAFDGKLKGFVIGGGVGYSPYTSCNIKKTNLKETFDPLILNGKIGHGMNKNNLIVVDIFYSFGHKTKKLLDSKTYFWANGIRWFHYFNSNKYKLNYSLGISILNFKTDFVNIGGHGLGVVVGTGAQIKKHLQIEISYVYGNSASEDYDNNHRMLSFTLTALAY